MAIERTNLVLVPGEELVEIVKTEMWSTSNSLLVNFIEQIKRILWMFIGVRLVGQLVITNKRVVIEETKKVFWIFNSASVCRNVLPQAVSEIDFSYQAKFLYCLCRQYSCNLLTTSSAGWTFSFTRKEDAVRVCNEITAVVTR